jgi:tetratricopeptide (TPR) repeat protein
VINASGVGGMRASLRSLPHRFVASDLTLPAIVLLALSLRLAHVMEMRESLVFQNPVLDGRFYHLWAQQILSGTASGNSVFVLNPGYAYFLAALYRVFHASVSVPVVVQCVFGAASCLLVHRLGALLFDRKTALLAAALAAVYPVSILYDGLLVTAGIVVLLNLLAISLLLTLRRSWHQLLPGAVIGVSALFRPTVLAFVPFALVWLAAGRKRRSLGFFVAGCAAVLLPVLARNYAAGGQFTLASAGLGMNLSIGNNPRADGAYAPQPFESGDPQFQAEEYRQEASRLSGRVLDGGETSTFWLRTALGFIAGDPAAAAALLCRKAALFVNKAEIPTNMDLSYLLERSFLGHVRFLSFGVIFPLALFGMITAGGAATRLLQYYVAAYFLANLVFFVGSEYRYPVMPALFVFCAGAVTALARVRSAPGVIAAVSVLGVLGVASNVTLYENDRSVIHNNLGNIAIRQGLQAQAIAEYRTALEIDPDSVPARVNLASIYFNRREYDLAIAEYRRVVDTNPSFADAHYFLGLCYYSLGKYREALPHFGRALELRPDWRQARTYVELTRRKVE